MSQTSDQNRRFVLASRPEGAPVPDNFRLETDAVPEPGDGEVLLRTVFLSLDPYMRGRMSDAPSYAAPVEVGGLMVGGTVCRVAKSRHPDYAEGDWVLAYSGWQDYALSDGKGLFKLDPQRAPPSWALGILGMPGFTAYMGLTDIGQPKAGETVVVAAASGAVGSVVGQVAKLLGCRVVGIAGGKEKCDYVTGTLGFDACIDHRQADMAEKLKAACPDGIDVYFENVGGKVFDAVLPLLNSKARIPLCGLIASYNATELPPGPDRLPLLAGTLLKKRIRMQGFIIFDDYGDRYGEFLAAMQPWLAAGKLHYREDIVDGLERAPEAFIGMLEGANFGKLAVRVGPDDATA
ncbi:NADP-dependent oxidoreductase [Oleiagrimonas sp. MCCC 1A03011]|uniref:NADP-dependent oxidoreductase n=1 Tax=Oleiagrimonas sp. MCCC 1A03011 TaxID=1926883 RepID=UPI000DC5A5F5|nr:NADP-dependent oxidoreductase [Oleiagrimonas sp. MCCC 1A03011]RAP58286.1 NADP-dependent oxidoreductase [Oleiagrimonas sp. MCCC 1A03011]